jgi:hypothetical protein
MIRDNLRALALRAKSRLIRALGEEEKPQTEKPPFSVPVESPPPSEPLPPIPPAARELSWGIFRSGVETWVQGFEVEGAEQPDRLSVIQRWGEGKHTVPILIMAHEARGLQLLVRKALRELNEPRAEDLEFVNRVAANMIQVCHMGFPDLMGTYDYGTAWTRN